MSPKALLSRLPVDPYIMAIVGMVCLASGLPAYGSGTIVARYATNAAIALLFFLQGAAFTPCGFGRRVALAAAHRGACLDVRSVSGVRPWREGAVSEAADAAALDWRDPALRTAVDSPIVDRLYLDRSRQRPDRALRRDRVQPFGHGIDAVQVGLLLGAQGCAFRPKTLSRCGSDSSQIKYLRRGANNAAANCGLN
jgi:hypothetical protein